MNLPSEQFLKVLGLCLVLSWAACRDQEADQIQSEGPGGAATQSHILESAAGPMRFGDFELADGYEPILPNELKGIWQVDAQSFPSGPQKAPDYLIVDEGHIVYLVLWDERYLPFWRFKLNGKRATTTPEWQSYATQDNGVVVSTDDVGQNYGMTWRETEAGKLMLASSWWSKNLRDWRSLSEAQWVELEIKPIEIEAFREKLIRRLRYAHKPRLDDLHSCLDAFMNPVNFLSWSAGVQHQP